MAVTDRVVAEKHVRNNYDDFSGFLANIFTTVCTPKHLRRDCHEFGASNGVKKVILQ